MSSDLYQVLGVDRNAGVDEIKAAYRKLARTMHPDAGGGADDFRRLAEAYAILSSSDKRAQYDATGKVDGSADNEHARILEIIGGLLNQIIEQTKNLARIEKDVTQVMRDGVAAKIKEIERAITQTEADVTKFRKLAKRFKVKKGKRIKNLLRLMIEHKIGLAERGIAAAQKDLADFRKVAEILEDFDFEVDLPVPEPARFTGTIRFSTNQT